MHIHISITNNKHNLTINGGTAKVVKEWLKFAKKLQRKGHKVSVNIAV